MLLKSEFPAMFKYLNMVLKSAHVDSSEIDEKGTSTYRVIVIVHDTYYLLVISNSLFVILLL
jgi:hypothetical protein